MTNNIIHQITQCYDDLTEVEKRIAGFFVNNREIGDFSAKTVAGQLYISEASLSRFAKKVGFRGYREFIYEYQQIFMHREDGISRTAGEIFNIYSEVLKLTRACIDEAQIQRIEKMLQQSEKVCVYGMGSSGFAARDIAFRFMRMGLNISAITDSHEMKINAALADERTLVIAISLSGTTKEVLSAMRYAKSSGAGVVLITMNNGNDIMPQCDEILRVASIRNLDHGSKITPQLPVLVMLDILFTYFLQTDFSDKVAKFNDTLEALEHSPRSE